MLRKRISKLLAIAATAACVFGVVGVISVTPTVLPTAAAETLSNGLNVDCTKDSDVHVTCVVSGCPRVDGDYVVDKLQYRLNGGGQVEPSFKCINGETARVGVDNNNAPFDLAVQACRHRDLSKNPCTPWANFHYTPPAGPPPPPAMKNCGSAADFERADVPVNEPCVAKAKPQVDCPPGSPTPKAATVAECAPIPDVVNAIQATFGDPRLSTLDFNVTNTSKLAARCDYTATASGINPLVPKTTKRTFTVPANGNHTETFRGAPTLTTYNVELVCHDASGQQKAELGRVNTSVTW